MALLNFHLTGQKDRGNKDWWAHLNKQIIEGEEVGPSYWEISIDMLEERESRGGDAHLKS